MSRREKESQIKALQDALEDALEAKIKLQTKYEKELQDLQQSNSSLLDDFEWKLHQVESTARKKLLEKEKEVKIGKNCDQFAKKLHFHDDNHNLKLQFTKSYDQFAKKCDKFAKYCDKQKNCEESIKNCNSQGDNHN